MNDVPLREHDEKRETNRNESTESGIAEKNETDGTAAPRAARQDQFPAGETRGEMMSHEGAPDSNLAAKRAMASDLIGMGFRNRRPAGFSTFPATNSGSGGMQGRRDDREGGR